MTLARSGALLTKPTDNVASTISKVTRRQLAGEGAACNSVLSSTDNGVGYGVENAEDNVASALGGTSSSTTTGGSGAAAPPPPPKGPKARRQADKIANGLSDVLTAAKLDAVAGPEKTIGDNVDGELTSAAANAGAQVGSAEESTLENVGKSILRKRQADKISNGAANVLLAAHEDDLASIVKDNGDSIDGQLTGDAANAGAQIGAYEEKTLEGAGKAFPK